MTQWKKGNNIYLTVTIILFIFSLFGEVFVILFIYNVEFLLMITYIVAFILFLFIQISGIYYYRYIRNKYYIEIESEPKKIINKLINDDSFNYNKEVKYNSFYPLYDKIHVFTYMNNYLYIKEYQMRKDKTVISVDNNILTKDKRLTNILNGFSKKN